MKTLITFLILLFAVPAFAVPAFAVPAFAASTTQPTSQPTSQPHQITKPVKPIIIAQKSPVVAAPDPAVIQAQIAALKNEVDSAKAVADKWFLLMDTKQDNDASNLIYKRQVLKGVSAIYHNYGKVINREFVNGCFWDNRQMRPIVGNYLPGDIVGQCVRLTYTTKYSVGNVTEKILITRLDSGWYIYGYVNH